MWYVDNRSTMTGSLNPMLSHGGRSERSGSSMVRSKAGISDHQRPYENVLRQRVNFENIVRYANNFHWS